MDPPSPRGVHKRGVGETREQRRGGGGDGERVPWLLLLGMKYGKDSGSQFVSCEWFLKVCDVLKCWVIAT